MLTAGGISIKNFYRFNGFIRKGVPLDIENMLRPYYFGGRCEIFGNPTKGKKILHFDFRGMYGECMKGLVPSGKQTISTSNLNYREVPGFYYIKYFQNMKDLPVLPFKGDKLFFKNGLFEGLYWFEEIQLFLEEGGEVLQVVYSILPEFYNNDMRAFILMNEKIKSKGGLLEQVGKNNINTLYGRLGINRISEVQEIVLSSGDRSQHLEGSLINGSINIVTRESKRLGNSNLVIAASITSKARVRLYRGFMEVIRAGGRLLYCDTDSIIAEFPEEARIENRYLGEVYFDTYKSDTIIKDAVFCLPKTYALRFLGRGDTVKIKGLVENSISFNKLKWLFYSGKGVRIPCFTLNKRNWDIRVDDSYKYINLQSYDKRLWDSSRKQTSPISHARF